MNPREIGVFIKQLRNEKGITQEQLAEIKEILNGERKSQNNMPLEQQSAFSLMLRKQYVSVE